MRLLGIDYGRAKIGLALSEGKLAEPLEVIRYQDVKILRERLRKMIQDLGIEKVVVGISEGEMGTESKNFSLSLSSSLTIPVETFDETLTTQEAQKRALEAHLPRKKRRAMEDAFAAAVMLQLFIDKNV